MDLDCNSDHNTVCTPDRLPSMWISGSHQPHRFISAWAYQRKKHRSTTFRVRSVTQVYFSISVSEKIVYNKCGSETHSPGKWTHLWREPPWRSWCWTWAQTESPVSAVDLPHTRDFQTKLHQAFCCTGAPQRKMHFRKNTQSFCTTLICASSERKSYLCKHSKLCLITPPPPPSRHTKATHTHTNTLNSPSSQKKYMLLP